MDDGWMVSVRLATDELSMPPDELFLIVSDQEIIDFQNRTPGAVLLPALIYNIAISKFKAFTMNLHNEAQNIALCN